MKNSIVEVEKDYLFNLSWIYEIQFTMPIALCEYHKPKRVTVELNLSVNIE